MATKKHTKKSSPHGRTKWGIILAVLAVLAIVPIVIASQTSIALAAMPTDSELTNGLWYSDVDNPIILNGQTVSFMKIYTLGGPRRVMELSTYPRAYKDTSPHVYTQETAFTVTLDNLNYENEKGSWYRDETTNQLYALGSTAYHHVGDPLPGSFPLWVATETLATPRWVDNKDIVLPMVFRAVKGELVSITILDGAYRDSATTTWTAIPPTLLNTFKTAFASATTEIRVTKIVKNKNRMIIRLLYDRIF